MAACYKCDACGKVIADRYKAKMKEFYISYFADDGMLIPWNYTRKVNPAHLRTAQMAGARLLRRNDSDQRRSNTPF